MEQVAEIMQMTDASAEQAFAKLRWPETDGSPVCDHCGSLGAYRLATINRFRCRICGRQFSATSGTFLSSRKMPIKIYLAALAYYADPKSNALKFSEATGLEYKTSWRLSQMLKDKQDNWRTSNKKRGHNLLTCANCDKIFLDKGGEKTSEIKHGKLLAPYCSFQCRREYRSKLKENDCCKRCKKSRKELMPWYMRNSGTTGVTFNYGYCQKCYGLLKAYNFDEKLCKAHELTQTLKKETTNVIKRKEHRRSAENASGIHRGSPKGESRSPAGTGYQRPVVKDFTIRPVGL